jgi:hypothetical protein
VRRGGFTSPNVLVSLRQNRTTTHLTTTSLSFVFPIVHRIAPNPRVRPPIRFRFRSSVNSFERPGSGIRIHAGLRLSVAYQEALLRVCVFRRRMVHCCLAPRPFVVGSVGLPARSSRKPHPSRRHLEKSSTPRSELGLRVSNNT